MIGAVTFLLGLVLAFLGSVVYFFYGPMPTAVNFPVPPVTGWRPGPGLRAGAHFVCRRIAITMHTSCSAAWSKFSVDDYRVQPIPDQFHTMVPPDTTCYRALSAGEAAVVRAAARRAGKCG